MSHPNWCVVVEAHSDEDCHPELKPTDTCVARVWHGYSSNPCGKKAKGWRQMWVHGKIDAPLKMRPACGTHLRYGQPGADR